MSNNQPAEATDDSVVDRNFLAVKLALDRVVYSGGNPQNQMEMQAALRQVEKELKEIH